MDADSTELQVAAFLHSKGITLDCPKIKACRPLPPKKTNDKAAMTAGWSTENTKLLCSNKERRHSNSLIL